MTPERWGRVKEVFQSAIERDEGERQEYLAAACGSDALLRQEVDSLLRKHSSLDGLISPVRKVGLSGRTITHFRVIEKLGQGGMGVVYRAEDQKLGRTVALKFLAPHMAVSEEHRARFVREARVLGAIDHPNICAVHEIDEAEGRLFLAMSFVNGPTLKAKIAQGPIEVDEALRIVIDAARGLQAAHRTGVIHRDVKSANIMLDAEGRVIITDFGLAHLEDQPGLSQTGMPMGTPDYMSPEQVRGEKGDRRSDIWSLGVVLYEAISGKLPFPASENPASILSDEPAPLTSLRPETPPELDGVVRRALAKAPGERYQAVEELAADLRRILGHSSVEAIRDRRAHRFSKWKLAAATFGLVLLLAAGAAFWTLRSRLPSVRPDAARISVAVLPLQNLSGDAEQQYFTDGMTEAIITDLAQIGALRVVSRTSASAYRSRGGTLAAMARELRADHVVEGSVLRVGDRVRITVQLLDARDDRHLWAHNYEGDLRDILRLQSEVAQAIAREVRVRLTPVEQARLSNRTRVNPRAHEALLKGYHHTLKGELQEVLKGREYFQQAMTEDPGYAPAYAGLANTYVSQGFHSGIRPTDLLPKAEAAVAQAIKLDAGLFPAYNVRGTLHGLYERNWPEAERCFRRALELAPQDEWSNHQYAAHYLVPLGRLEEALERIQKIRDSAPLSVGVNVWVGWIRLFRREYGPAVEQLQKTLELDPSFEWAQIGLAVGLAELGRFDEALAVSEGPIQRAWVLAVAGKKSEARRMLSQLIERSTREYVGGFQLAAILGALGESDAAFRQLERSYQDHQPRLAYLKVDPRLDPLRSDQRFRELLRKMNLDD